jgi:hypothetical protein
MIYLNSRYANGSLQTVSDPRRGRLDTAVFRRFGMSQKARSYTVYVWVEGDRIDIVAARFYSDPTQYWRILDENPSIADPSDLTPGTSIRIPNG